MKVLNVNVILDPVLGGGTADRTFKMSRYMTTAGISCTVLTTQAGLTPEIMKSFGGIKIIALPLFNRRFYVPRRGLRTIFRHVNQADIIHLMNHWNILNALVYVALKYYKKSYVVCPAGALPIYGRSGFIKKTFNWIVGKKIIQQASACIAISENEIEQFESYGVTKDKVVIIPNGISEDEFFQVDDEGFRRKFKLDNRPIILFLGRLNSIKGPDLLVSAYCRAGTELSKKFQLVVAGPDGGMLGSLKDEVKKFCMEDNVTFVNYLGGTEKSQAFHAASLLVIPSRSEAMSIVALEAGVTGTPVLLTNRCGFSQLEKIGGGCVVSADIEELKIGMIKMLNSPKSLKEQSRNIKSYVTENYLWKSLINRYTELYIRILTDDKNR